LGAVKQVTDVFGHPKSQLFLEFVVVPEVALEYETLQFVLGALFFYACSSETLDIFP
jgi:hypothetical protein